MVNLTWIGVSSFLYNTIINAVFVRPFKRAWGVIRFVIELCQTIIYHVGMVYQLAQKLSLSLLQGTNMWVIMTGRLFAFIGILMGGWLRMTVYYFFNKHIIRDIPYGTEGRNFLDIYLPMKRLPGVKVPVIILVSGGAWIIGYKLWNCLIARGVTYFGYIAVLPDHRNYPQGNIVDMITDVRRAVEWTIQHIDKYSGDNTNIIIGGQSAGAHVSLSMLVELYKDSISTPTASKVRKDKNIRNTSPADTDSVFGKNQHDDFALKSADILSCVKLYIGISGPYNLTEIIYHLHNRGLDYSMLSNVFDRDMCKYSPSIQLANIAKIPMKKTFINVNMSEIEHQMDVGNGSPCGLSSLMTRPLRSQSVGSLSKDSNNSLRPQSLSNVDFITRMSLTRDYDDGDESPKSGDDYVVYADPKPRKEKEIIPGVVRVAVNRGDNFVNDQIIYAATALNWFGSIWVNLASGVASFLRPVNEKELVDGSYDRQHAAPFVPVSTRLQHFPAIALYHGKYDKSIPFYTTIELSNILRLGGLSQSKIHVSIYNNWGHTDGMLEEMLCGDMTLIVDMYELLYKYCPIGVTTAEAVPAPVPMQVHAAVSTLMSVPVLVEDEDSCNSEDDVRARLESEKAKATLTEYPEGQSEEQTPHNHHQSPDFSSNDSAGASLPQRGLSDAAARQMQLFVPADEDIGVLGCPYRPMVPKTFGTIAKYVNPF